MPVIPMPAKIAGNNVPRRFFSLVVASDRNHCIGKASAVPWDAPEDRKFFRDVTTYRPATGKRHCVVMGRKTFFSIPQKFRPLPNRLNVVLTSNPTTVPQSDDVIALNCDLSQALVKLSEDEAFALVDRVFVIGGATLYDRSIEKDLLPFVHAIYRTVVDMEVEGGDTFFDCAKELSGSFHLQKSDAIVSTGADPVKLHFETWQKKNNDEKQYLEFCRRIIETGNAKGDRTGTGTRSLFGGQMRFSLENGVIPLLTTKRVFWRGVCEELLWFIKANTNGKCLADKGVHIWDANGSRDFLDQRGLKENAEGDLGPVYGFQWRHFGADYKTCKDNYDGQGVDQIAYIVDLLKNNPNDRRIILSAWNPAAIPNMALPPCHILAQFYVADGKLSCMLYQRSCDMGLGVPFNVASYSLLTVLLARAAGLVPGEFIHTLGDAHVYNNHVDALEIQMEREPIGFPHLRVKRDRATLEEYTLEDFEILDYLPYPTIKMDMAV